MRLLIALILVVMTVEAQERIYVFTPDTVKMKRAGWVLDYSEGLIEARRGSFMEFMVGMKRAEPKPRAQKKALLQEASKRSADFEEILCEAEGKPDAIADWFIKNWEEYEAWCAESVYVATGVWSVDRDKEAREIRSNRMWIWMKQDSAWRQREVFPSMRGFIDYLERRKK